MKKLFFILAVAASVAMVTLPAEAGRWKVDRRGHHGRSAAVERYRSHERSDAERYRNHERSRMYVHREHPFLYSAHPIHRSLPAVIVRTPRGAPRIMGHIFLPPVAFHTVTVVRPAPRLVCWEDSESFYRGDDWVDFTLNAGSRGSRLFLEVADGRPQLEFAEVVYDNGECQVVDFGGGTLYPGTYQLVDLPSGRYVDHVRFVARAQTDQARVLLMMER